MNAERFHFLSVAPYGLRAYFYFCKVFYENEIIKMDTFVVKVSHPFLVVLMQFVLIGESVHFKIF